MAFKGLPQPLTLYEITGLRGRYALALPAALPEVFTPLVPPLPSWQCFPLVDKAVGTTAIAGTITRLAASAADATLEAPIALYTNVKILLGSPEAAGLSAVYAKVLPGTPSAASRPCTTVRLAFTVLAEDTQTFLVHRRDAT